MKISIAILGLTSFSLLGCSDHVSGEDLNKEAANIRKKYDGRLHQLELWTVDPEHDFNKEDSSTRRFAKRLLNSAYKDAKDPITEQEIEDAMAQDGNDRLGELMLEQFDTINGEQNKRLGAIFRQIYDRKKKEAAREKEILDKLQDIENKFAGKLHRLEYGFIGMVRFKKLVTGEAAKFYNELLDSIYCDRPKYSPITEPEIRAMIEKINSGFEYDDPMLVRAYASRLLNDYATIPEMTKKRVKGWFDNLERLIKAN